MRCLLLSLFLASTAMGNPPTPPPQDQVPASAELTIPTIGAPEPPKPVAPPVGAAIKLYPDTFFVVTGKVPFMVLASPADAVNVTYEKGPLTMRGKFVDNPTKVSTRHFSNDFIVSVEAVKNGPCELMIFKVGETDPNKVERRQLDIAQLPNPPNPDNPPAPGPVDPTPTNELRVMFLYERDTLKPSEASVMNSQAVNDYLKAKCVKGADGKTPDFRFFDQHDDVSKESATIQEMFASAKASLVANPMKLPVVVIFNGKKGLSYPLPSSGAELLALLKKAGG